MSRSSFGILALVLVVIPSLGQAQDRKSPLVGYLSASTRSSHAGSFEALRKGLRELGYIEAQNIVVEARFAEGNTEKLAELVSELLRLNPDIILAGGSQALRPVWEATKTVPIVVAHIEDPLREGFVRSLSRPGGNVTGLSRMAGDLEGKRLELLKETLPGLRRVSMFFNPSNPTNVPIVKEVENAAKALGLTLSMTPRM